MKKIWIYWITSFLFAIGFLVIIRYFFPVHEMLKLQFASSAAAMHEYIMSIGPSPDCYHILKMNTLADYGFLLSYAMLTYFSFRIFLDVFQIAVKPWVYVLSFLPATLDAIENVFLLRMAINQQEEFSAVFFWIVRIKWAVAIIPLLLIPMILFYALILLFRAR